MRDLRRKRTGMDTYKDAIGQCCNPDCNDTTSKLHTHHIRPVTQDGANECVNYIVLCQHCHNHLRLHTDWYKWQEKLYRWKFYAEILLIGSTSDDYDHVGYIRAIRAARKADSHVNAE